MIGRLGNWLAMFLLVALLILTATPGVPDSATLEIQAVGIGQSGALAIALLACGAAALLGDTSGEGRQA